MRKTILYIVILAILGFGVYWFLFAERNNSPFPKSEAGFTIKDTADIYKVFLTDRSGHSILLERTPKGWTVNKQFAAIPGPVNRLLGTMYEQEPQYPVAEKSYNAIIKSLAGKGIKVEVYNKAGEAIRVFYVGNEVLDFQGTFMMMEGATKPYVVQVPGQQGYLTPRYSTNLADWRERIVFNLEPAEIKEVRVTYAEEPLNSFTVKNVNNRPIVTTDPALMKDKEQNSRRATAFLKFFGDINSEGYINGVPGLDSTIRSTQLRCTIEVTAASGLQQRVDIYWKPINRRSKNLTTSDPDIPDQYDADRFYAVLHNTKDTALVQRGTFDKILRKGYEFFEEDAPQPVNVTGSPIR